MSWKPDVPHDARVMSRLLRRAWSRLRATVRHRDADAAFADEIESHLELMTDDLVRRGMPRDEAHRFARRRFGGVEAIKVHYREQRGFPLVDATMQDIRHACRALRTHPGFASVAVISLGLGIGATTAVFSVANALLLRPPDGIAAPRALVDIGVRRGDSGLNPMPYATYVEVSQQTTTLAGSFAQQLFPRALSLGVAPDTAERAFGHDVTTGFFETLGVEAAAGRVFTSADAAPQAPNIAVLSHAFWTQRFNRNPAVIGTTMRINGFAYAVIGVAAPRFHGTGTTTTDIWLPLRPDDSSNIIAGGRVRDGATVAQVAAETAAIGARVGKARTTAQAPPQLHVLPSSSAGGNRNLAIGATVFLMGIAGMVLVAACANLTAISLARATTRTTEMAVRAALGAGRGRLARQLLVETLVVFALGGVTGLALARGLVLLVPLLPRLPFPTQIPLALDANVILFTSLVSLGAALASGLAPAFTGSQVAPAGALKDSFPAPRRGSRLRAALVAGQIALAVLLVVLTALFVRALRFAGATDPGFDPTAVALVSLDLSAARPLGDARGPFWQELLRRVRALPDVESATLARVPPGGFEGIGLGAVGTAGHAGELLFPAWNIVDTGYFATLRIPMRAGRDFSARDIDGAAPVAIVGDALARQLWPNASALGQYLDIVDVGAGARRSVLVVGVAADVKSSSLVDGLAASYVYLPAQQSSVSPLMRAMTMQMSILARGRHQRAMNAEIDALVRELDPTLALVRSETLSDSLALGLAPQRVLSIVTGALGSVGLALTLVGIYGVAAFAVARRRTELAIRTALGASRMDVLALVLRHALGLTVCGSLIGLALAAAASQVVSAFLYGLPPLHAPTFIGAALLFLLTGLCACYVPARRVLRWAPASVLRRD